MFIDRTKSCGRLVTVYYHASIVPTHRQLNPFSQKGGHAGNRLRHSQTGRVNSYVTMVLGGITLLVLGVLYFVVWR